ncbi:MAG TPA: sigma-70 family RNA polymerase sigma factor [Solirubrobacteraceae bacterium]|jgi:RNA polymerase sigma-70 factor (ECF subfamily)|nr:sigma-70 family RNA polymerase sigma factor [Solirubrobacteraceae bacterium]
MQRDPLPDGDDDDLQSDTLNDSAAENQGRQNRPPATGRLGEFEHIYRAEFGSVVGYFARRYVDPQLVADLAADTFIAAVQAYRTLDPASISPRAWTIGIARGVNARYLESDPRAEDPERRRALQGLLDRAERKELMWRLDVERSSRELIERLQAMSKLDREAIELVDLCGLSGAEAARELGISAGALRVRLVRSRARLRREGSADV